MSYLTKFERRRDIPRQEPDGVITLRPVFYIQWRSVTGSIELTPPSAAGTLYAYYKRRTKLGGLIRNDRESERHYLAKAIAQALACKENERIDFIGL